MIYSRTLMFCTPAEAERITVAVFTTVWAEVDRIDPLPYDVRKRLLIACNQCILSTLDEEAGRQPRRSLQTGNPLPPDEDVGALTAPANALRQLAPPEREAIVHTLHTGMSYRRVAAVTGRSHAAIAADLRRGLQALHRAQVGPASESPRQAVEDARASPLG